MHLKGSQRISNDLNGSIIRDLSWWIFTQQMV
jgi:hypothetical protein